MSLPNCSRLFFSNKYILCFFEYCAFFPALVFIFSSATVQAEVASTATLAFEVESFDLDSGSKVSLINEELADIRIAYNSQRTVHGVVFPAGSGDVELSFVNGVAFESFTAEALNDLSFSSEPIDLPLTSQDTVIIKTNAGAFYKIGNTQESPDGITFNYSLVQ